MFSLRRALLTSRHVPPQPRLSLATAKSSFSALARRFNSSNATSSSPLPGPSAQTSTPPINAAKPKPNKSSAALKRTASASLPVRQNPTPSRSPIRPVFTLATAERYNLASIRQRLPFAVDFEEALWIPSLVHKGTLCELWIFENGSIVCWGAGEGAARAFIRETFGSDPSSQIGKLDHAESEELEFVTDPSEKTRLQGDLIILGAAPEINSLELPQLTQPQSASLPTETAAARYAFSHALARSTSLSGLESALEIYLHSVSMLPHTLSATGKPGLERKEIIMKLGQLLKLRQSLNLTSESYSDTPDFYWAEPALEEYFNSVSKALEIRIRTKSVNEKITYAAELQSTLRELLTESTAHRMELIIIALIAVEVVIAFIRDGPELVDTFFGDEKAQEARRVKH